ncbi:uncharacterized protein TRAVEDRAFT_49094 [Trametes versicolor FP-101664 SS1]|uniref:uncharacterized protein n=1 Tax=Trametes versicolor (strain FP-101664) TaxID=717944 RepID=UPI0004622B02|nr:uncharacterized protein TRAVEDRAFT_49094 [Trametes versicolor FP-101664 SS1]EIW56254.1 hypothetical protein TRAVEDRAFT_49094 [Trametes versicolor FP-101664 SS1]
MPKRSGRPTKELQRSQNRLHFTDEFFAEWPADDSGKPSEQVELQDDYFKTDPQMNLSSATLRTLLCERREDEESDSDSEINGGGEGGGKGGSRADDSESDIDEDDDEVWDF